MAEVAPAGAKEVDQRPNTHDPFWDGQNDILKTYSFNYQALTEYKQKLHRSYCLGQHICFPPGYLCAALTYPCDTPRRPPRHRRDACSMAWRCRLLTARPSQDGRVIADK